MARTNFDWNGIISDLARRLGSAFTIEQLSTILDEAQANLLRIGEQPDDFWQELGGMYERVVKIQQRDGLTCHGHIVGTARAMIHSRGMLAGRIPPVTSS
jgi:hypothetical protein